VLFNSLAFLLFFPVTTAVYFALPHRARWAWLLACSTLFYASFIPKYLFVLLAVIVIDYAAGIGIESSTNGRRKLLLGLSLGANIGILAAFKYFDFFSDNLAAIAAALHWNYPLHTLGWALPIGLSFHTFQSMAYTIEVYRGRFKAERHFGIFALYVLFYPQLVAGPIERPAHLLPQFRVSRRFDADRASSALRLMLWGLFKKIVIADRMAIIVDLVYRNPSDFGGGWVVLATWLFAIQIYCDFSGYTDMAIGAARMLGIDLCTNFARPYESSSVAEFWRRWHISLSTWFRDYVYLPLGGNRVPFARWCVNVGIVFVLSGLWHGANWTFVIWGALHGFFLVAGRLLAGVRRRFAEMTGLVRHPILRRVIATVVTFQCVSFAWLFFRATSLAHAELLLSRIAHAPWFDAPDPSKIALLLTWSHDGYVLIAALLIALLLSVEWAGSRAGASDRWARLPAWLRWPAYDALVILMLWLGDLGARSFIYFQF
jgi:D-alanyl-lipoteichoic acid acyltransferase DltB (MBOAT superfamily)